MSDEVRVNRSGFDFSCPACGLWISELDLVYTVRLAAWMTWPLCESCGLDWCAERGIADPVRTK